MATKIEAPQFIPVNGNIGNLELWKLRAQLPGFRSVMSLRHDEKTCDDATLKLKEASFSLCGDLSGKDVLELGTGVGRFTQELAVRAKSVKSVDISFEMLERANEIIDSHGVLINADVKALPFPNSSFDVVYEMTTFMHLVRDEDFKTAVMESKRVLKPDGLLFLCGHLDNSTKCKHNPFTMHRTIEDYKEALNPLRIVVSKIHMCVDEPYTMILAHR